MVWKTQAGQESPATALDIPVEVYFSAGGAYGLLTATREKEKSWGALV